MPSTPVHLGEGPGTERSWTARCAGGWGHWALLTIPSSLPTPRKSLQRPALRATHFCRQHAQVFRWILVGLLCTGECGPAPLGHHHLARPAAPQAGSFPHLRAQHRSAGLHLRASCQAMWCWASMSPDCILFPKQPSSSPRAGDKHSQQGSHPAGSIREACVEWSGHQGGLPGGGSL